MRNRIRAYCLGGLYCFECPPDDEAEPVAVELVGGAWTARGTSGDVLVYTQLHSYGVKLNTALQLGLCRAVSGAAG